MPMISKYSRPLTTTPTMPSAIATITRNRKKAIIRSSAQLLRLAPAQPPLAGGARLVGQAVVLEDGLFLGHGELAVGVDRGGILHLLLVVRDLEVPGAHGRAVKRHEYEPVPGRDADLDGAERRQVGAGVDVDRLQLPDLVVLGVNHVVATPFPDVGRLEHAGLLPARRICLQFYPWTRVADKVRWGSPDQGRHGRHTAETGNWSPGCGTTVEISTPSALVLHCSWTRVRTPTLCRGPISAAAALRTRV